MLQCVAMITPRVFSQGRFNGVQRDFGAGIAIGVNMNLNSGCIIGIDQGGQTRRFNIP